MIKITYSREGFPVSDFEIKNLVQETIKTYKLNTNSLIELNTSTEEVVWLFTYAVRDGIITKNDIEIYSDGVEMRINNKGEMLDNFNSSFSSYYWDLMFGTVKFSLEDE